MSLSFDSLDFEGYALGGLSVGEPKEDLLRIVKHMAPLMQIDQDIYNVKLLNIVKAVESGIDMFDCVIPTRHLKWIFIYSEESRSKKNKRLIGSP